MRIANAPVSCLASRHHYQLLYLSQQLRPTEPLSRIGYYTDTYLALSTLENAKHSLQWRACRWNSMSTPRSKPIAVLKHIPVNLHWQQEVKAFIGRDVKLGVLETLRVGEPVTDAIGRSWLGRKMTNHGAQWTCRCSTNPLSVKHTTPNSRSTSQRWYLQGPRRRSSMLATGSTECQSEKIAISLLSSFVWCWYRHKACPQGYAASEDG